MPYCITVYLDVHALCLYLVRIRGSGEIAVACDIDEVGDERVSIENCISESSLVDVHYWVIIDQECYGGVFDMERDWVGGSRYLSDVEARVSILYTRRIVDRLSVL